MPIPAPNATGNHNGQRSRSDSADFQIQRVSVRRNAPGEINISGRSNRGANRLIEVSGPTPTTPGLLKASPD